METEEALLGAPELCEGSYLIGMDPNSSPSRGDQRRDQVTARGNGVAFILRNYPRARYLTFNLR